MSQYIHYKFDKNSSTITNYGTGGSAYNGQAARNQYRTNSLGHPAWGPLTGAKDGIIVPGGISSPTQHTWQIGLNIARWWPVNGVIDCMLVGNDGKLWSIGNDTMYAYLHEECSWNGNCSGGLTQIGTHWFSVEVQGASYLNVEFYLGVGSKRPVRIAPQSGSEGALYQDFNFNLQLNTNYYFQISVSTGASVANSYGIGNCTQVGAGCNDASNCGGFPCGCYLYSWREDNAVLDLANGGNWADDVPLWAGGVVPGGGGSTPVANCPCKHIWCGIAGAPTTSLYKETVDVNKSSGIHGTQGWINNAGGWIANKPDATAVTIVQRDPKGTLTNIGTIKPDAKGNFSGVIPSPKKTGAYHYNAKGASGNWGNDLTITWGGIVSLTSGGYEGSTPAACTPNTGELAVLVRGTDNHVYIKQQQHGVWGVWKGIGGIAYSGAGVGAASWGGDRIDAFVTGTNNSVYHASNANGWAWATLAGVSTSSLGATSDATNEVTVFCRGSDGACWYKEWNGSAWSAWTSLGGVLLAETGPCACSMSPGRRDVFVTGTNGVIYHKYRASGGSWSSTWENLTQGGFQTTASPGAAAVSPTQLAVFAQGKDNSHLYMLEWNDGAWDAAWLELGGTVATGTGPGVCADATNYHVFVTGTNAQIYHAYGNGDVWYAWENLGGKDAIDATEPAGTPGGIIPIGTGGLPGGPTTTPPSPQDLTLVPVNPVPSAMPAGISVVLRDHKKSPTGGK